MKSLFLAFGLLLTPVHARAERPEIATETYKLVLAPQSRVWLTGDSTLHPYTSTATAVDFIAALQRPAAESPNLATRLAESDISSFTVTIPVAYLKSGEKGLDKNMHKALKSEKFPTIEFRLSDKRLLPASVKEGTIQLKSNGVL